MDAMVRLIGCSGRYADQLTTKARERAREEREARIIALKAEGKTVRDIAGELGVSKSTVSDAVRKKNSAETGQADEPPAEKPEWDLGARIG
jgi:transposase